MPIRNRRLRTALSLTPALAAISASATLPSRLSKGSIFDLRPRFLGAAFGAFFAALDAFAFGDAFFAALVGLPAAGLGPRRLVGAIPSDRRYAATVWFDTPARLAISMSATSPSWSLKGSSLATVDLRGPRLTTSAALAFASLFRRLVRGPGGAALRVMPLRFSAVLMAPGVAPNISASSRSE